MNDSTEQLILELRISRNDVGVYTWTTFHSGNEIFDEWQEPESSIEGCLLVASTNMPEDAIVFIWYRGVPMKAFRGVALHNEGPLIAEAVVAMYAELVVHH
jgi:hypothetical protein